MANYLDSNGLSYLWSKLKNLLNGKANSSHTHEIGDVTNLNEVLMNVPPRKWITHDMGISNGKISIQAFGYGNDRIVAIGNDGMIAYSDDFNTWTLVQDSPFAGDGAIYTMTGVAYGNGRFVCASYNGKTGYSTDGINWTLSSTNIGTACKGIAFGNGIFIAVTSSSRIRYSTDGINWTTSSDPMTGTPTSIVFGNGIFVIGTTMGRIYYGDGVSDSWDMSDTSYGNDTNVYINTYADGYFIGHYGDTIIGSSAASVWNTIGTSPFNDVRAMAYGNGKLLAIGYYDSAYAYPMSNAITWTSYKIKPLGNEGSLCYCKDRFLVGGGNEITYSIC